ncbi:unnamed protein product [Plutella xylostella]|uniref:(diamondback moth) hypothetical protein n=1 Tax=Plutella xylostella TaxID=51655 RepID=A0A8S4EYT1_PLUXY|nr:unnamed protein product [Plutella xylostella]
MFPPALASDWFTSSRRQQRHCCHLSRRLVVFAPILPVLLVLFTRVDSGDCVLHVSKWLVVKRAKIQAKPRPKPYPDQLGQGYSSLWEEFTDISKTGQLAMVESEPQRPCTRRLFSNISQPR